ncbi:hypothetical protein [Burkholderia ubonensis]|uniref:hypothetical protein n=1 Tax=Burkholderia ubonensis TaxID=101571 RepID=UPI000AC0877D|nr:hypothetical protein [Burkholderia ubonensis]
MKYGLRLIDDNGNTAEYQASNWASVATLASIVKAAAATEGFERFARDGALVVHDESGNEVAHADGRSGWTLPRREQ